MIRRRFVLVLAALAWLAAGCSPILPPAATDVPSVTATNSVQAPTPTASPASPLVLLVAPEKPNGLGQANLAASLQELAATSGLRFLTQTYLSPSALPPGLTIAVIADPSAAQAADDTAAHHPEIQFVIIDPPAGLKPADNVSLIVSESQPASTQAFLAGYIASVITYDWRVGMLASRQDEATAFTNGATYYCGLCRPVHPPYHSYPITVTATAASSASDLTGSLVAQGVQTAFVPDDIATPDMLSALAQAGIHIISTTPPPADASSQWAASLIYSAGDSIKAIWPDIEAGKGGSLTPVSLTISDVGSEWLTPGRMRLAEAARDDLLNGFIDIGVSSSP